MDHLLHNAHVTALIARLTTATRECEWQFVNCARGADDLLRTSAFIHASTRCHRRLRELTTLMTRYGALQATQGRTARAVRRAWTTLRHAFSPRGDALAQAACDQALEEALIIYEAAATQSLPGDVRTTLNEQHAALIDDCRMFRELTLPFDSLRDNALFSSNAVRRALKPYRNVYL